MVLRKPYAFFIKHFKLIHIILSALVLFLLYKTVDVINFLNDYLNSTSSVVGQQFASSLFSSWMIIIPIIIIFVSGLILGIMFKKQKPYIFYLINIFIFIVVLVLCSYSRSFIISMEETIMNIKAVKLTHDLLIISILIESFSFVILLVRGLGLNFKKFDFSSDLMQINIDEKDKEEIEISVNVDINKKRRDNRKKLRYLKYFYVENKFIFTTVILILTFVILFVLYYRFYIYKDFYSEGTLVSANGINFKIDESYLLDENDEFYLVGIDFGVNTILNDKNLLFNDLILQIENYKILPTKKYCNNYTYLGTCYNDEKLNNSFNNYLMFYEVPKIYYESDIFFKYITVADEYKIKVNPIKLSDEKNIKEYKLGDNLVFEEKKLKNIKFKINSYDLSESFIINYDYCYKNDDCLNSIEYIKPSFNSNFDKIVLKLNVDYESGNNIYNDFYKLFEKYGTITYKIGDTKYTQKLEFEELKSSKKSEKNTIYISVIEDVLNADDIAIEFNVRNNKYRYVLRGE